MTHNDILGVILLPVLVVALGAGIVWVAKRFMALPPPVDDEDEG